MSMFQLTYVFGDNFLKNIKHFLTQERNNSVDF